MKHASEEQVLGILDQKMGYSIVESNCVPGLRTRCLGQYRRMC
jgi:hypothetical protein